MFKKIERYSSANVTKGVLRIHEISKTLGILLAFDKTDSTCTRLKSIQTTENISVDINTLKSDNKLTGSCLTRRFLFFRRQNDKFVCCQYKQHS